MIDLHSHILPGVDDGVATLEEARALARAVMADGATAIAATPHVREDWPTSADRMEEAVAALRMDFAEQGIGLEVLTGGEISLEQLEPLGRDELRRFTLAGSMRYLLVEFPYAGWPLGLESAIHDLGADGLTAAARAPRAEQGRPGAAGAARAGRRRRRPRPAHRVLGGRAGRRGRTDSRAAAARARLRRT